METRGAILSIGITVVATALIVGGGVYWSQSLIIEEVRTSLSQKDTELLDLQKEIDGISAHASATQSQLDIVNSTIVAYLQSTNKDCAETGTECLKQLLAVEMAKSSNAQRLQITEGGLCMIRDNYTSLPAASAPDVGPGYAKLVKPEAVSIADLRKFCTSEDYGKLLDAYCAYGDNYKRSVQTEVVQVNKYGFVESTGCSGLGCGSVGCQ